MFSVGLAGMSMGPLAAAATFAITGNTWHVDSLQRVILLGMVLALVPVLALLCLNDDHILGSESDAIRHHSTRAESQSSQAGMQRGTLQVCMETLLWLKCVSYLHKQQMQL